LAESSIAPLALIVAAFVCTATLWSISPELALLSFIALRPLIELGVYRQVAGLTLGQVWGAAFLVVVVGFLVTEGTGLGSTTARGARIPGVLIALLAAYGVAALSRGPFGLAALMWLRLAAWVLSLVAAETIGRTARGQRRLLYTMGLFAALLVLVVALLAETGRYGSAYYSRPFGQAYVSSGQGPHGLATDAVLALPMVLILIWEGRHRLGAALLAGSLCICVVLSFVRSAYAGLAVVLVVFIAVGVKAKNPWVRLSALGLTVAAACSVYLLWGTIQVRLGGLISAASGGPLDVQSTSGRLMFWQAILRYSLESPAHFLFGGGPATSYLVLVQRTGLSIWAHNDLLEMLATGGIALALVYVLVVVWMLASTLSLWRDRRQSIAVRDFGIIATAAVTSFAGMSLLNGVAFSVSAIPLAVLLGLVRSMSRLPGQTALDVRRHTGATESSKPLVSRSPEAGRDPIG